MRISVITMFPELFDSFLNGPIIRRASDRNLLQIELIDIKQHSDGSFRHIDDSPYGGGAGMILKCEPIMNALNTVRNSSSHTVLISPQGTSYTQKKAHELIAQNHLILICGHYEGIDARIEAEADEEISAGDYILSGGEIPAMAMIDSIARLCGTIRDTSTKEESFENGLLEYPQYTKPREFKGKSVPEVLLSGHNERIRIWRLKESLRRTLHKRPDLLANRTLTEEELNLLNEIQMEEHLPNPN
ncbi:MAG: tRNA (guanosine(37)-N1)-methyltransferase TrmD [Erysipelotrichia bacterium]|nr:tRNA (guanosine(37)-N1)-methyltransferase TrmD [Erysipelotrichia bacterium]